MLRLVTSRLTNVHICLMMEAVSCTVYAINIQFKNRGSVRDVTSAITAVLPINRSIQRIGNVYAVRVSLSIRFIFHSKLYFKLFLKLRQFIKLAISFNLFFI